MRKILFLSALIIIMVFMTACSPADSDDTLSIISAPDFTLENTDGAMTSLSDYSGQAVLLYFHMAAG